MTPRPDLSRAIDSTLLAADAGAEAVRAIATEALRLGCAAVCVNPVMVREAAAVLSGSRVGVASVAGFPLGASPAGAKIEECRFAIEQGATELDIVLPIWAIVSGEDARVEEEAGRILEVTSGVTRKLIVEMGLLAPARLEALAAILNRLRPEFAKTGTGYAKPVTVDDVTRLRRQLDPAIAIKAAGGIRSREEAEALLAAGATRIGTSRAAAILG